MLSDHARYARANRCATGVEFVLVNGVVAIDNGRYAGALAGNVLLKTDDYPPKRREV